MSNYVSHGTFQAVHTIFRNPRHLFYAYWRNDLDVTFDQCRESDHTLPYLRQKNIAKLVDHICSFVTYLLVDIVKSYCRTVVQGTA